MEKENEILCHVDETDRMIGPCPRGEVHRLGLRHRSSHILLLDSQDRVFLQRRGCDKSVNPGLWDTSAAGHVAYGEGYEACALRELGEELGVEVAAGALEPLFKVAASAATGWEFIQVYRVRYDGVLCLEPGEIIGGRWLTLEEVDAWISAGGVGLTETFQHIWRQFRGGSSGTINLGEGRC